MEKNLTEDQVFKWENLLNPLIGKVEYAIMDRYYLVCAVCSEMSPVAGEPVMPWPEDDPSFKETLDQLPDLQLALGSRLLYYWGELSLQGHELIGSGGSWKFSYYCDQLLR